MEHPTEVIMLGAAWQYRLEVEIARSTFGVVWQAQWLQTGTRVALKTVNQERMAAADSKHQGLWPQALSREVEFLRRMQHPHLVCLRHDGKQDDIPVLVLEQLHTSLARSFRQQSRPLAVADALEKVRQVASGLAYLHSRGMRHLDIKPENLLLTAPGPLQRLKIADLGSAMGLPHETRANQEHGFIGTLGWLAPEQVLPSRVVSIEEGICFYRTSAKTDVYALGLLLFFLLTGEKTEFNQQAALALQNHNVLAQRDFLAHLAQDGLTERDSARLAIGLSGRMLAQSASPIMPNQSAATWSPRAEEMRILPINVASYSHKSPTQIRLETLLQQMLTAEPALRFGDAHALYHAINALQCSLA